MRETPLITEEYYHIYNRGVDKRDIFTNKKDLERFSKSVIIFNDIEPTKSLRDVMELYPDTGYRGKKDAKPLVSIVCYTFNPNHFHFIIKQEVDGGISEFFMRLLGGYSKYFNKSHDRSGALFQGKFKAHVIDNEQYFSKIHSYVHMNDLVHDIPVEKKHLVRSSVKEYENQSYDLVSEKEAEKLLGVYQGNENFKKECMKVISIIREERGKTSLLEEDHLP